MLTDKTMDASGLFRSLGTARYPEVNNHLIAQARVEVPK